MINATWHQRHPMPAHATAAQRLRWHQAHAKACRCRVLAPAMLVKLRRAARQEATRLAQQAR
jgi:hypothetical protein